ncbi:MAG TPA: hypothetical protein VFK13_02405 [Gemmatimonadaceae bacterium]|nr:hypothetical protein [Gemmatimonadaceae bacterium]
MHFVHRAMRIEVFVPTLLGILIVLIGGAFVADGLIPDGTFVAAERRRRPRPERDHRGEVLLGLGIMAAGTAVIGRDTWRYSTLAVLVGAVLIAAGLVLNLKYVRGIVLGPVLGHRLRRRASDRERSPGGPTESP